MGISRWLPIETDLYNRNEKRDSQKTSKTMKSEESGENVHQKQGHGNSLEGMLNKFCLLTFCGTKEWWHLLIMSVLRMLAKALAEWCLEKLEQSFTAMTLCLLIFAIKQGQLYENLNGKSLGIYTVLILLFLTFKKQPLKGMHFLVFINVSKKKLQW